MKKGFVFLLTLLLILCSSGCTSAAPTTTTAAETTISADTTTTTTTTAETTVAVVSEPAFQETDTDAVTLTMTTHLNWDKELLWGEDEISRLIMDMTGVKIEMLNQFTKGDKISALIASGELGDLVATGDPTNIDELSSDEYSYDLDTLAAEYCPTFWDDVEAEHRLASMRSDGKVYSLSGEYITNDVYDHDLIPVLPTWSLLLRQGKYETVPASVEELDRWLYSVQEEGVVPLAQLGVTISPVPGWMGLYRDLYWDEESGSVRTPLRQDGWVEYLQLMHRWYKDGRVSFMTVAESQQAPMWAWMAQNSASSASMAVPSWDVYSTCTLETLSADSWDWTVVTQPLTWEGEVQYKPSDNYSSRYWGSSNYTDNDMTLSSSYEPFLNKQLFITKTCHDPERAIGFYRFLLSDDGLKLTHWGIKDQHYTQDTEGRITYTEDYRISAEEDTGDGYRQRWSDPDAVQYWNFHNSFWANGIRIGNAEEYSSHPKSVGMIEQYIEAGLNNKKYLWENKNPVLLACYPDVGSDDDVLYEKLLDYWVTEVEKIVTESQDSAEIPERWNDLCRELITLGIDDLETRMTNRYTEALKRYQAEGYYTD